MTPTHQPYELQLTAQKSYGLFATEDISKGQNIITEDPLILLSAREKRSNLLQQLRSLSPEQHMQYTDLTSNMPLVHPHLRNAIRLYLEHSYQYRGPALDAALDDMVKLHAIFFTNAVSLGANGRYGEGLFPTHSRINHSCLPNVQNNYNPTIGKGTVHAIRDIKAGEELVGSYISTLRTKDQRHKALAVWGFECECEVCDGKDARAHEVRRRRLFEIDQSFVLYESGNAMAQYMVYPVPDNDAQALELAVELVDLLLQEGLLGVELARAYRECSKYSARQGYMAKAFGYAKKELEVEITCLGEDTDYLERGAKAWFKELGTMSEAEKIKLRMNEKRHAKEQKKANKKAAKKEGKRHR